MRTKSMTHLTVSDARANLYRLMDQASVSHQPVIITGKRGNAVLLAEEDWRAIQETVSLLAIPGMRKSIRSGLKTPVNRCAKTLKW